jgi:hypothetical protein
MKNKIELYDVLQPEVVVGLGDNTTGLDINDPAVIEKLHVNFEDWLGDDLIEVFPCYLVTEKLKTLLTQTDISGYEIKDVEVTKDDYFSNNYQLSLPLPKFYWLKINGIEGVSDLFINTEFKLSASHKFLQVLKTKTNGIASQYLEINPSRSETDDFLDDLFSKQ